MSKCGLRCAGELAVRHVGGTRKEGEGWEEEVEKRGRIKSKN